MANDLGWGGLDFDLMIGDYYCNFRSRTRLADYPSLIWGFQGKTFPLWFWETRESFSKMDIRPPH
jgi:hypothetical protein